MIWGHRGNEPLHPQVWMARIHGPLTRYAKLRVVHAPGMPGTSVPPPRVRDPDMHHGTCVTHVPWCMPGSLTSGFLWSRCRGKRSRHSRRMHNPQFCVSGKRSMQLTTLYYNSERKGRPFPWWRHQMETLSASLAICAGKSTVTGEFPAQRPVMRIFDVFFDLRMNKRLSKRSWGWWFETPSHPLWRHCNAIIGSPVDKDKVFTVKLVMWKLSLCNVIRELHAFISKVQHAIVWLRTHLLMALHTADGDAAVNSASLWRSTPSYTSPGSGKYKHNWMNLSFMTEVCWWHSGLYRASGVYFNINPATILRVSDLSHHCFKWWFITDSVPNHYLNQYSHFVD